MSNESTSEICTIVFGARCSIIQALERSLDATSMGILKTLMRVYTKTLLVYSQLIAFTWSTNSFKSRYNEAFSLIYKCVHARKYMSNRIYIETRDL